MKKEGIIKILITSILILIAIGIAGCGGTPPIMSLNITYPNMFAQLDGNGICEITWDWVGPNNKKVNIILIGYTQSEEEMGELSIDINVSAAEGSYTWGPNFGELIFLKFGSGENWPNGFRIEVEVAGEDVNDISDPFSVQWNPA